MGTETTVRGILEKHGFSESSNKPGLFYLKTDQSRYFVDMRTAKTKYYGFDKDNNQIEQSTIDIILRKVRRDLSAAGCGRVEDYNTDIGTVAGADSAEEPGQQSVAIPAEQHIPECQSCGNTLTFLCHSCGATVCSRCGGKVA